MGIWLWGLTLNANRYKNILLFTTMQMFFVLACCASGGSSEQSPNVGQNTEVCVCVCYCVYEFAYVYHTCISNTAPLLLPRKIVEITIMRTYRSRTRRQAQEAYCRQFMPLSTLPQSRSTMPASVSRCTLSKSKQTEMHILTDKKWHIALWLLLYQSDSGQYPSSYSTRLGKPWYSESFNVYLPCNMQWRI